MSAATNDYFIVLWISRLVYNISENGREKYQSQFPKAQDAQFTVIEN